MGTWSSVSFRESPRISFPGLQSTGVTFETESNKPSELEISDFEFPKSEASILEALTPVDELDLIPTDIEKEFGFTLFANVENTFGDDDRVKVTHSKRWPFSPICRLILDFAAGTGSGTGTLISENLVITAGHNLFMKKYGGWAESVRVIPGAEGSTRPYGIIVAAKLMVLEQWTDKYGHYPGSNADLGLILLSENIGQSAGCFGLTSFVNDDPLVEKDVIVSGYPGDLENGKVHYGHMDATSRVGEYRFGYVVDTASGQSGSPVYDLLTVNGIQTPRLLGVHTTGFASRNSAVRITPKIIQGIESLIS